jgi:hypothetical protein
VERFDPIHKGSVSIGPIVQQEAEVQIDAELRSFLAQVEAIVSPKTFNEVMDAVRLIGERSVEN